MNKEIEPIRVEITQNMLDMSAERDKGKYNNRSFEEGRGNFVGFIGEYMTKTLSQYLEHIDCYNYDFLYKKSLKIDVKTKTQTVPSVRLDYEASVDVNSMHQDTDIYIFCRVYKNKLNEYPYGWVMGWITKEDFLKKARRLKKGEKDGSNGYVVRQDCYNICYKDLRQINFKQKENL